MYKRSETLNIEDKLHFCKEHKEICIRELDKWEFQLKCLPQKQQQEKSDLTKSLLPIILLSVFELAFFVIVLVSVFLCFFNENPGAAIVLLLIIIPAIYGAIYCIKAWRYIYERASMLSRLNGQKTFYEVKITNLRKQIAELDEQMQELTQKKQGLESIPSGQNGQNSELDKSSDLEQSQSESESSHKQSTHASINSPWKNQNW